jgi:hypothetical protein
MGNVQVKLNLAGVKEVLNDDASVSECMKRARRIASEANSQAPDHGYYKYPPFMTSEGRTTKGNRCAVVYTRTELGKRMQAKHSTLTKALKAGRG